MHSGWVSHLPCTFSNTKSFINPYYANQDLDFKIFSHIGKKQAVLIYNYFYYDC